MERTADALERLLPSFYEFVDEESLGVHRLEEAVPDSDMIANVLPQTAWDDCWVARRGEAVECFPTYEQAEAWVQEGSDAR